MRVSQMTAGFSLPIQIDYVDTDAGGVVYHANYLAFMERVRSACLRQGGFPVSELKQRFNLVFVVTESSLKFHRPAVLDDVIDVSIEVLAIKGASVHCRQQVTRLGELLVDATIRIATITSDTFSPCKIPPVLREVFERHRIDSVS